MKVDDDDDEPRHKEEGGKSPSSPLRKREKCPQENFKIPTKTGKFPPMSGKISLKKGKFSLFYLLTHNLPKRVKKSSFSLSKVGEIPSFPFFKTYYSFKKYSENQILFPLKDFFPSPK
jgi:hypothetical protein